MKVVIIGRTQILYETALALHNAGHEIISIITAKAAPEYTRDENDFENLAMKINASFLVTNNLNQQNIRELCKGADIGISVNWVSIINQDQIKLFRLGILNSHHGDLPKYRGNACANWAILKNEDKIVNSIHFMEGNKLDCGRIICQEYFNLDTDNSITEVYKWTEESTPHLFLKALDILEKDEDFVLKYADPNTTESFRCYPRLYTDNYINWENSVTDVHNLIRAVSYPFLGAYTFHWDKDEVKKLIILKSRIIQLETNDLSIAGHVLENDMNSGESLVKCGDGIIALMKCRYEDEQEEFYPGKRWNSIRMRLGVKPEDWLWSIYKKLNIE